MIWTRSDKKLPQIDRMVLLYFDHSHYHGKEKYWPFKEPQIYIAGRKKSQDIFREPISLWKTYGLLLDRDGIAMHSRMFIYDEDISSKYMYWTKIEYSLPDMWFDPYSVAGSTKEPEIPTNRFELMEIE